MAELREALYHPSAQLALPWHDGDVVIADNHALLHGRRMVHRDLSPSNVRLTDDGHCKLLDFGALASFGHVPNAVLPSRSFATVAAYGFGGR